MTSGADNAFVVDASVAIKWHLQDEELVEEATRLLDRFTSGLLRLRAPAFIRYEMANSLEQARRRGRIGADEASAELHTFVAYGVHTAMDSDELIGAAQQIARAASLSLYDAVYLAYAEAAGLPLITQDQRLARQAIGGTVMVYPLADVGALL